MILYHWTVFIEVMELRTLVGFEAIAVAEKIDVPLFDRVQNMDLPVEQVKSLIQRQRDAGSFVLQDWPESDKEAEQVVLRRFHVAISAHRMTEATVADICALNVVGRGIHPYAAELAAKRLVEQRELEVASSREGITEYRIPRNAYFKESFLDSLRVQVCDECGHLDFDRPFHKTCLMALIDYLVNEEFMLSEVIELGEPSDTSAAKLPNLLPAAGARWLSQTVSATKGRLKSVVKPMLIHPRSDHAADHSIIATQDTQFVGDSSSSQGQANMDIQELQQRTKISKSELIAYLRNVEVVDEGGELTALRSERDRLMQQLHAKEQEIQQVERQRSLIQGQCDDMQRDMDTLIQALRVAKRRGYSEVEVIDAEVEGL